MRLPAASESYESVRVAAHWFAALLHVVSPSPGYSPDRPRPRGISRTDLAARLATKRQSSLAVPPLSRVSPALPGTRVSTNATSHGVRARPAHEATGIRLTREFPHSRQLPTSGFLTLLPVCSPRSRPGLFHPGNARRVPPYRGFPSQEAVPPRRRTQYPHGVFPKRPPVAMAVPTVGAPDPRV
jgi:hypothetical protein